MNKLSVFRFSLPSVSCGGCVPAIEHVIKQYQEYVKNSDVLMFMSQRGIKKIHIKEFDVDSLTKILTIVVDEGQCRYDELQFALNAGFNEVGHQCEPLTKSVSTPKQQAIPVSSKKFLRSHAFQGGVGIIVGGGVLALSMLPFALPFAAMIALAVISTLLTLIVGAEFYWRAKKQFEAREPAMDLLFALSTITALIVSVLALFVPGLPMMFEAGLLIFGFRHIGLAIRDTVAQTMRTKITHQAQIPKKMIKLDENNCHIETHWMDVVPGDRIVVFPGEMIPTDGIGILCDDVTQNDAAKQAVAATRWVSTSNIDGATFPRQILHDEPLLAGMKLLPDEKSMLMKVVGTPGYRLKLNYQALKIEEIGKNEIVLNLFQNKICFCIKNNENKIQRFIIEPHQLINSNGQNYTQAIIGVLSDPLRKKQLSPEHYEQIYSVTEKLGFAPAKLESYLKRLDDGIESVERTKPAVVKQTEAVLKYFVPSIIVLALVSGIIIGCFFPLAVAIHCTISVLVAACPCTLGLITPLAVRIGIQKASLRGVRFNQSQALEDMARVNRVIFDLHGTLTTGKLSVDWPKCKILDETLSEKAFLEYFALLEQEKYTKHPIGQVIYKYAISRAPLNAEQLASVESIDNSHHSGLGAMIAGEKYLVGNKSLLQAHGIDTSNIDYKGTLKAGDSVVFLVRGQKVLGYVTVNDPLRPDAVEAVKALKADGIDIDICSGEEYATVLRYARELGIDAAHVHADCRGDLASSEKSSKANPKRDKKGCIEKLPGHKLMVVDAANDSVAMKTCTSIAIKHAGGDEITQQEAGAVIENGSLRSVVTALTVSKHTMRNIKQNLWFSLIYNIASVSVAGGVLLTLGVTLSPGIYVALMIVQMGLILLNAYRFQCEEVGHLKPIQSKISQPTASGMKKSSYSYVLRNTSTVSPQKNKHATPVDLPSSGQPLFNQNKKDPQPVVSALGATLIF